MTGSASLKAQFNEFAAVLRALRRIERQHRKNKRPSADLAELIAASRASFYLMIYNSIESAIRFVLKSIREKIASENLLCNQVHSFWHLDSIQASFLSKMQDGTNHGNVLRDIVARNSAPLSWDSDNISRLPSSGNFGKEAAFRLKDSLGMSWSAPQRTLGGDDLENVRKRRNALAHGLVTFKEVGNNITAGDLEQILDRVHVFMVSFIEALERYRDHKSYIIPP